MVAAALACALGLASAPSASALPGLHRAAQATKGSTLTHQEAVARCEDDEDVIGGGASVWNPDAPGRIVGMMPQHVENGADRWYVSAELPAGSKQYEWNMTAYAVCVQEWALDDYVLKTASVGSDDQFKAASARCPAGTVAWGSGASVNGPLVGYGVNRIGLQLNRTSEPLDISRATARAENSYTDFWTLYSTAICARPANFVTAVGQVASSGTKAIVPCGQAGAFFRVHGPGGGGGVNNGGPVWLRAVYPFHDLSSARVSMTGTPVGGLVANATCAA